MAHAEREFAIMEKLNDENNQFILLEFKDEIVALCNKFGNSGQSGGSAPYVASAISNAVRELMMFKTITPLIGSDDEWNLLDSSQTKSYQNNRVSAVFKDENKFDGKAYYLEAIIFQGEDDWDAFTGSVLLDNGKRLTSRQPFEFPFTPKSFRVNVKRIPLPLDHTEEPYYEEHDGTKYRYVLKDPSELEPIRKYGYLLDLD